MLSINKTRWMTVPLAVAAALALASCSSSSSSASKGLSSTANGPAQTLTGTVTVLAAASLQTPFTTLAKQFEAQYPKVTVKFSFGGSDTLAAQITQGAPADVFAAASTTTMGTVVKAGDNDGAPATFTRNELEIAVAPGNPLKIASLADLAKPGVKVSLCAATVPCGAASQTVLQAAGVKLTPVTFVTDDTTDVTDVETGQVDASLVYHSDIVTSNGKLVGVDFPQASAAINTYPIVALKNAPNAAAARAFVAYVLSNPGAAVLTSAGFLAP